MGKRGTGRSGFAHHPARARPDGAEPVGDLLVIAHRGRKHQQGDALGQVDHGLLPYHPALFITQIVGFVQDHKIGGQGFAPVHGVIELVAQYFSGAHDDGGVRVFLAVAGQNAHMGSSEMLAELDHFRVGQGFERRGVPGPAAGAEHLVDGLHGYPGLAGSGGGCHQAIGVLDDGQGLFLKCIGYKLLHFGGADFGKQLPEPGIRPRPQHQRAFPGCRRTAETVSGLGGASMIGSHDGVLKGCDHGGDLVLGRRVDIVG